MLATLTALVALQAPNTLSDYEKAHGWKLLFDGETTNGWVNFKSKTIGAGWQVKDGALTIADAEHAGDIVTTKKYDWFELSIEFNMEKGQNSGIMYHVADTGDAIWHSGPEIQIYDHPVEEHVETTGYLYQLYPAIRDTSKPAGEWNIMRIHVAKDKCWTSLNGTKLYEYVLGSEDFWARVKKSKFAVYPNFGKIKKGTIGIQGDHGLVAFRNIKIKTL
jgi:hypothetical protein